MVQCFAMIIMISRLLVWDVDVSPQILQSHINLVWLFPLTFQVCLPFSVEKMLCYSDYHKNIAKGTTDPGVDRFGQ